MNRLPVLALSVALVTLAACTRPTGYYGSEFDRRSGDAEFNVVDQSGGAFTVNVRMAQYQFVPDMSALEERCRREALAVAHEETERRAIRGARVEVNRVRSSAGRNIFGGITSCTASVPVTVSSGA